MLEDIYATLDTEVGKARFRLYAAKAPLTVVQFVNLVQRKFYDGLIFHRAIKHPRFVVQGGCPEGDGRGSTGYYFEDEFHDDLKHDAAGVLSSVNFGKPHTNSSQFFITLTSTPWLDKQHSVFGKVVSDKDLAVVEKINKNTEIHTITIDSDVSELCQAYEARLREWNKILDHYFALLTG